MKNLELLAKYNGKIYHLRDGFALKWNSGAFHYTTKEILKFALENGFKVGYDKKVYYPMPWGMQHTSYKFEESESFRKKLTEYLKN